MISWNEEKIKILMLISMAQTLKKKAESTPHEHHDAATLINEYKKLFQSLSSIDTEASKLLPHPSSLSTFDDGKFAVEQFVNYVTAKAVPLYFEMLGSLKDWSLIRTGDPLAPLMPTLNEWKLSTNWAVGASALALIEVMVNKKLEELGLSKEGSFETKFKRLSSKAKEKGIHLPDLLAGPFYKARSSVIHEGKEPSPEELEIIIRYLTLCSSSLKKIEK